MSFKDSIEIEFITDGSSVTYGVVKPGPEDERGIRFIRGGDVVNGKIKVNELRTITQDVSDQYKRTLLKGGELLVSLVGNPGEVAVVPEELAGANIARQVGLIRVDLERFDPYFVQYYLMSPAGKAQLFSYSLGSVQKVINLKELKRVEVPDVPLGIQKQIVKVLKDVDDKIELNRQTNQTLEHIAQAIFKSWFVDFEPTRAKIAAKEEWAKRSMTTKAGGSDNDIKESQAEATFVERAAMAAISGRAIDSTNDSTTGALVGLDQLNPEQIKQLKTTAALFPDTLVDSELGEIPEGWEVNLMEELVDIGSAKRIFSKEYIDEGVPFYRGKEVTILSGGNNITPEIFISESRYNELKEKSGAPKENDILITSVGTIGNTYLVQKEDKFYFKDGNLTWIKAYKKFEMPYFLKIWFDSPFGKRSIEEVKIGSTQQAITITSINSLQLVIPNQKLGQEFNNLMKSNFDKRNNNLKQVNILSGLRDSLLPKLLSGELEANAENAQ